MVDDATLLAVIVTVLVAITGYFATYLNNLSIARRNDRLKRVNRQISDFYGPLFALVHTTNTAWEYFRQHWGTDRPYYWPNASAEEAAAWRLWMEEVFMPKNLKMEKIIVENIDLIDEPEIPNCLLDLLAHVAAYKTVVKRWEEGDFREHTTDINFPRDELLNYVEDKYKKLKAQQLHDLEELDKAWSEKLGRPKKKVL